MSGGGQEISLSGIRLHSNRFRPTGAYAADVVCGDTNGRANLEAEASNTLRPRWNTTEKDLSPLFVQAIFYIE